MTPSRISKIHSTRITAIICAAILLLCSGCTKEDSSSDGGSDTSPRDNSDGTADAGELKTSCGVVFGGSASNPIAKADGIAVRVKTVTGPNLAIVQNVDQSTPTGEYLVKLHGVSGSARPDAAIATLKRLSYGTLYFYPAQADCIATLPGGGQGVIGQLVTNEGQSLSEELIKSGLGDVDAADACGGGEIGECLTGLKGSGIKPKGEMRKFLWKPQSDTKGNIAVVHELHCNVELIVNGQKFEYVGGGNGRCGTYKATRPGCAYGANIRVEVIDKTSGQPYTRNGQPYVIVPNGCSRFEFD